MNFKKIFILILCLVLFNSLNSFAKKKENHEFSTINRNKILNKYQNDKKVEQIICVNFIADSSAILKMYIRDNSQPTGWNMILATDAFVGRRGIDKERESDFKTPTGDFNVTEAFGIKDNPGTTLNYIKATDTLYYCDENSKYYNQIIDTSKSKHSVCSGEHIIDYPLEYAYALCFDFNPKNIFPNGSAIFIHAKGNKNFTAGCIAIDEDSMKTIIKNSTTKTKVCIYKQD